MTEQNNGGASGGEGADPAGGGTPWYGEAHKATVETKGWKTADDVITSYSHLETLMGHDRAGRTLVKPKDATDADGIKAFRLGIGVPEKEDGYQFPDELKDDPLVPVLRSAAYKHGIPAEALKSALPEILAAAAANDQRLTAERDNARKAGIATLQSEWGAGFDAKKESARRAAEAFTKGMDAETVQLFTDAAQNDPRFMRGFAAFGAMIQEHPFEGGSGGGNISVAQANEKLQALQTDRAAGKVTDRDYWERRKPLDEILSRSA
jgi:hypothetical protein